MFSVLFLKINIVNVVFFLRMNIGFFFCVLSEDEMNIANFLCAISENEHCQLFCVLSEDEHCQFSMCYFRG